MSDPVEKSLAYRCYATADSGDWVCEYCPDDPEPIQIALGRCGRLGTFLMPAAAAVGLGHILLAAVSGVRLRQPFSARCPGYHDGYWVCRHDPDYHGPGQISLHHSGLNSAFSMDADTAEAVARTILAAANEARLRQAS